METVHAEAAPSLFGAGVAQFEPEARGVSLGRQVGQRPSDKKAKRGLAMHRDGLSYRLIGQNVGLSKNTVMEIVRRGTTA
jgi:hypothetical protein